MKIKIIIILFVILLIIISLYFWNLNKEIDIEKINKCTSDSDCIIVSRGYCGGALAINKNYLNLWNKYLEDDKIKNQGVLCKMTLPLDFFEAKCINNKCKEIQIKGYI